MNKQTKIICIFTIAICFLLIINIYSASAYIGANLNSPVTDTLNVSGSVVGEVRSSGLCPFAAFSCFTATYYDPCEVPDQGVGWEILGTSKNGSTDLNILGRPCKISCPLDPFGPCCLQEGYCSGCVGHSWDGNFGFSVGVGDLPNGDYTIRISAAQCGGSCANCSVDLPFTKAVPHRHENCCDNWGWDNVQRCGGCCGPAANCVGYDPNSIYYWHNSNEVWQCSYGDNQDSRYWFIQDCGSPYWTNDYRCIGAMKQRKYVDRGCWNGGCYSNDTWYDWEYCGTDYWGSNYSCNGNWRTREYFSRGCSGDSCYLNPSYQNWENCDAYDGWYGSELRDYYCSSGLCVYSGNQPPNTPTLIVPPNNTWINYNPSFRAQVSDLDGENVRAYFNVSGYGDAWGSWVGSGGTSEWPLVSIGDGDWWWRAYAQDSRGLTSNWTGYWLLRKDIIKPTAVIDQENGTSPDTSVWVNLTESDERSGIAEGDIDIRTNSLFTGPAVEKLGNQYSNHQSTFCDYSWPDGSVGSCVVAWWEYSFNFPETRTYNAGAITSNTGELRDLGIFHSVNVYLDGQFKGTFNNPASDPATQIGWVSLGTVNQGNHTIRYEWTNDWYQPPRDSNIRIYKVFIDDWQHYTATINNFTYTGAGGSKYEFRYRVKDNAGNWSDYAYDGSVTIIINDPPTATNLSVAASDFCQNPPYYTFQWTYSDPNIDTEYQFDFQVDNNIDFSSPEVNRSFSNLSYPSPTIQNQLVTLATSPLSGYLTYNTRYYWRTRVYDEHRADSGWINGTSFITFLHHYPSCDFDWVPYYPVPNELTQFTDDSRCYDEDPVNGSDCASTKGDIFLYDFDFTDKGGVVPLTSVLENPIASYSEPGTWTVKLQVTDSDGFTCSQNQTLRVSYPLPRWREVRPQ